MFFDDSWAGQMTSHPLTTCLPTEGLLDYKRKTMNDISIAKIRDTNIEWLEQFWSYDPTKVVYRYHTMYAAVQLALWIGFKEIYLLGADLSFGGPNHMIYNNGLRPPEYANKKSRILNVRSWIANWFQQPLMVCFLNFGTF